MYVFALECVDPSEHIGVRACTQDYTEKAGVNHQWLFDAEGCCKKGVAHDLSSYPLPLYTPPTPLLQPSFSPPPLQFQTGTTAAANIPQLSRS